MCATLCCACLGLSSVMCVALILVFMSTINEDTEFDGEERDDITSPGQLPNQDVSRLPVRPSRDRPVSPTGTSTSNQSSVPVTTPTTVPLTSQAGFTSMGHPQPLSTTASPVVGPRIVGSPFVCTVNAQTFRAGPPDGVCNVLFYDSLYEKNASKLPLDLRTNVRFFIDLTALHNRTQFGMSFAIESQDLQNEHTTSAFNTGLDLLWRYKITHFGILNAHLSYTSLPNVAMALGVLKTMYRYLEPKTNNQHVFTSLGLSPNNPALFRSYGSLMLQTFLPDIFVAVGHISYRDNQMPECTIMPPTIYKLPPGFHLPYGHTLNDSIDLLRHVADATSHPYLAASFALPARLYHNDYRTPNASNRSNVAAFTPCKQSPVDQYLYPAAVCPGVQYRDWDNYRYYNDLQVSLTYNRKENLTVTFDSERALRAKVCETKQKALDLKYGLAAYSIDYDSSLGRCPELTFTGPYKRVQLLGKLHTFLIMSYNTGAQKNACTVLT